MANNTHTNSIWTKYLSTKILFRKFKSKSRIFPETESTKLFDVTYKNYCMLRVAPRNYFNDIKFTSWPFFLGSTCFILFFYIILFQKKFYHITPVLLLLALCVLVSFMINWFGDLLIESRYNGRYNKKVRSALLCGFICFLISEVLLFGGFFWAYFDRVFNTGYQAGSHCLPSGTEKIYYWRWPLLGTFVLLTSGYLANESYYFLRSGSIVHSVLSGLLTIVLAVLFLSIQLAEYNGLTLTMSDNVFGSFFFLLTGFHGFHVTVGLLFLADQYNRLLVPRRRHRIYRRGPINLICNKDRHIGLACALVYWHFVDIIWLFLYINIYILNGVSISSYLSIADFCGTLLPFGTTEWNTLMMEQRSYRFAMFHGKVYLISSLLNNINIG